jgi:hypothetical protein
MNMEHENLNTTETANSDLDAVSGSLRLQSLEWFFAKSEIEKHDLKDKHFPNTPIQHCGQWGFHFTLGQIEEMYVKER